MPKFTAEELKNVPYEVLNDYLRIVRFIGQSNPDIYYEKPNPANNADPKPNPPLPKIQSTAYRLERAVRKFGDNAFSNELSAEDSRALANLMADVLNEAEKYYSDQEKEGKYHLFMSSLIHYMKTEWDAVSVGVDTSIMDKINPYHKDLRKHLTTMPLKLLGADVPGFKGVIQANEAARDKLNETYYVSLLERDAEFSKSVYFLSGEDTISKDEADELKTGIEEAEAAFRKLDSYRGRQNTNKALNEMQEVLRVKGVLSVPQDKHKDEPNPYRNLITAACPVYALDFMSKLSVYHDYLEKLKYSFDNPQGSPEEQTDFKMKSLTENTTLGWCIKAIEDIKEALVTGNYVDFKDSYMTFESRQNALIKMAQEEDSPLKKEAAMLANLGDANSVDVKALSNPVLKTLEARSLTILQQVKNRDEYIDTAGKTFRDNLESFITRARELTDGIAAIRNSVWFGSREFSDASGLTGRVTDALTQIQTKVTAGTLLEEDLDPAREAIEAALENANAYLATKEGKEITKEKEQARIDKIKESVEFLNNLRFDIEEVGAALLMREGHPDEVKADDQVKADGQVKAEEEVKVDEAPKVEEAPKAEQPAVTSIVAEENLKNQINHAKDLFDMLKLAVSYTDNDVASANNTFNSINSDADTAMTEGVNDMYSEDLYPDARMNTGDIAESLAVFAVNYQEIKNLAGELDDRKMAPAGSAAERKIKQYFQKMSDPQYKEKLSELMKKTPQLEELNTQKITVENVNAIIMEPKIISNLTNQYWAQVKTMTQTKARQPQVAPVMEAGKQAEAQQVEQPGANGVGGN